MNIDVIGFKQPYSIATSDPGANFVLVLDYTCYWSMDGTIYKLTIPAGFKYDGASVPRWVWSISGLTPAGKIMAAATIHDYLYENQGKLGKALCVSDSNGNWLHSTKVFSRKESDQIFLAYCKAGSVGKTNRNRAYWAVRLFGGFAWRT